MCLGLWHRLSYWISNKINRTCNKFIYSQVLWVYFIHKQPKLCKILSLFNVVEVRLEVRLRASGNHVTAFIQSFTIIYFYCMEVK
jgi:hypothetical protein